MSENKPSGVSIEDLMGVLNKQNEVIANLSKAVEGLKREEPQYEMDSNETSYTVNSRIKETLNREKQEQEKEKIRNEIAAFNLSIPSFIEKYRDILPNESDKITEICLKGSRSPEMTKATIQKELGEFFFKDDKNLALVLDENKMKLDRYFSLSEESRLQNSEIIWDVMNSVLTAKRYQEKQKEIRKIGVKNFDDIYLSKFKKRGKSVFSKIREEDFDGESD